MATVKLKVRPRTEVGKQGAKRTRADGDVPLVLYGEGQENVTLAVDSHDLRIALSTPSGRNVIIQLRLDGEDATTRAVIRDMERDPVSRQILHLDLQRISENKPVVMHVPVTVTGESPAVKEGRGILDHTMRQLEVKCLPRNIPEHIEVDISTLEVKHAIHVYDLSVPDVEILDNPDRPVVEVLQPTIFREPVAEAVEGAELGEEAGPAGEEAAGEGAAGAAPEGGGETQSDK
jgi:large subunit ribosomal protein L25